MLRLSIVDPLNNYQVIKVLSLEAFYRGGINEMALTGDINTAMALSLKVNTNLGSGWELLRDSRDYGLRLDTDDWSLGFAQDRGSRQVDSFGRVNYKFLSAINELKYSEVVQQGKIYKGSKAEFIAGIDTDFDWLFISEDSEFVYVAPSMDNFALLKDIMKHTGWEFRDNGLVNKGTEENPDWKPQILVGDVRQIPNYFKSTTDNKYETQIVTNYHKLDNPETHQITRASNFARGDIFTHAYVSMTAGIGTGKNTLVQFQNPTADYVDPEYPIVVINGNYYVENSIVKASRTKNRFKQMLFEDLVAVEFADSGAEITGDDLERTVYNKVKSFLRSKTDDEYYSYDILWKRPILPGNQVQLKYRKYQKQSDGSNLLIFDLNDTFYLRDVNYDDFSIFI